MYINSLAVLDWRLRSVGEWDYKQSMSVSVTYKSFEAGWAECSLTIDNQTAITTASYISHALESLLEGTVEIMRGQREARASFDEEPGEYRWLFKRIDDQTLNVRILWFNDFWNEQPDDKGRVVFDGDCRLRTFAGAVLSASQSVLDEYGIDGYKETWDEDVDFPGALQEELRWLLVEGRLSSSI